MASAGPSLARRIWRSSAVLALTTLVYYLTPLPGSHRFVFNLVWSVVIVSVAAFVTTRQVVGRLHEYRETGDRPSVGLETLANLLFIVAVLFAAVYLALSRRPGQIAGIGNHTDALYFSMTILSTVGFGDIHATGGLGRTVVMVQMLFDLVFVASAVGLVVSSIVTRSQARAAGRAGAAEPLVSPVAGDAAAAAPADTRTLDR